MERRTTTKRYPGVLQIRNGSSRCPGKACREILGRPVLFYVLERIAAIPAIRDITVATTTHPSDDPIERYCLDHGIAVFRGSEPDVLERVCRSLPQRADEYLVKFWGDSPLIDPDLCESIIERFETHFMDFDYVSNNHPSTYPEGMQIEIIKTATLRRVCGISTLTQEDREHVTSYLWRHPQMFRIGNIAHPENLHDRYRFAIDYEEDFEQVRRIIEALYPSNPLFGMHEIIRFLDGHPEIKELNRQHYESEAHYNARVFGIAREFGMSSRDPCRLDSGPLVTAPVSGGVQQSPGRVGRVPQLSRNQTVGLQDGKPELPDGFQVMDFAAAYTSALEPLLKRVPTFLAARYPIILAQTQGIRAKLGASRRLFRWTVASFIRARRSGPSLPTCDLLLFCSSPKPSFQPAINELARRLAEQGLRCAVLSPAELEFWSRQAHGAGVTVEAAPNYVMFSRSRIGRWRVLGLVCRSMGATFLLGLFLFTKRREVFFRVFVNPVAVWYELLLSAHRFEFAARFLKEVCPRLIVVTGEHQPFGAELLLTPASRGVWTICFFNEHPTAGMLPILSHEMWVWNQSVVNAFKTLAPGLTTKFTIVGKAEVDFALETLHGPRLEEPDWLRQTEPSQTLVFLSEFDGNEALDTGGMAREALRWIAYASRRCPEWSFVIKPRPFHFGKHLPGSELIANLSNVVVPPEDVSLRDVLSLPQVRAVAACGSSGLFVAAGVGKTALRLWVSRWSTPHAVIDEVAMPIHTPEELVAALRRLERTAHQEPAPCSALDDDGQDVRFPYRGQTVVRMVNLCLERLGFVTTDSSVKAL